MFSVMAGAKQRILCPFLGIISSIILIFVAWGNKLPGSMIMYGYNIVMQTVVFII
ncbi:MAG: nicotinamide mononucleotide transporter [Mycoplasmoidaceae bacterium]|nr:nicotinamide mononucleotide transporter [Mycoplasmoidaceae bacterium]